MDASGASNRRRGFFPGGSEYFNRYKIVKRQQQRRQEDRRGCGDSGVLNEDDTSSSDFSDHSLDADPDVEIQKVVSLLRTLSAELYLPLKEKHTTNLAFSPLDFLISAVMLKLACSGVADEELTRALFQGENLAGGDGGDVCSEVVVGLQAVLKDITNVPGGSFNLRHGHKVFTQAKKSEVKQIYENRVRAIYAGVEIEELDFLKMKWEEVSSIINKWAHSASGKMLGDVLTKRQTDNSLIYINPIYFEGNWLNPFNPQRTQEMRFFADSKEFVKVPMMTSGLLKNLLYSPISKLGCQALVLPYQGDRLSFVIFLPSEKDGLPRIETGLENLSPTKYLQTMIDFRKKLPPNSVFKVFLPRFKIDCTIDFETPMREMGIETIFKRGKADFSPMIQFHAENSPKKEAFLTQILQKVLFVVNELGTVQSPQRFSEAIQGEENEPKRGDSDTTETIEFCVNRPFYFQVIDMKSDLILLSGSCKNPLQGNEMGFTQFLEKYDIQVTSKTTTPACIKSHGAR